MQIRKLREHLEGDPDPTLKAYLDAKSAFDQAKRHLEKVTAALITQMEADQKKTLSYGAQGFVRKVTYVQTKTFNIDEKGLRKALTAKVFDRFTVRKLERAKLEAAMDNGEVDPMVVAKFVEEKPNKPYLRYSENTMEEE